MPAQKPAGVNVDFCQNSDYNQFNRLFLIRCFVSCEIDNKRPHKLTNNNYICGKGNYFLPTTKNMTPHQTNMPIGHAFSTYVFLHVSAKGLARQRMAG